MTRMIIGLDPHKSSNTIAVIDRDEELKTRRRFDNTDDGLVVNNLGRFTLAGASPVE